jgi:nucleotide-binding universal stress UspA family protein
MPETARADNEATTVGFRRVHVAYDGSGTAEEALALARRLRDPAGGALELVYVVPGREWRLPGRPGHGQRAAADAEAMLAEASSLLPAGSRQPSRAPLAVLLRSDPPETADGGPLGRP